MQSILDAINEWIKEILIGAINGNLSTMFGDVNEKVGTIAAEVGRTPQAWNANVFSMIRALSENVIVPIAGLVITYAHCAGPGMEQGNGQPGRKEIHTLLYGRISLASERGTDRRLLC